MYLGKVHLYNKIKKLQIHHYWQRYILVKEIII